MISFNSLSLFLNFCLIFWFKIGVTEGIVGGLNAGAGYYKYHVSVQSNGVHLCGGAIISPKHALTVAQCVIDKENNFMNQMLWIVAGVIDLAVVDDKSIRLKVEKAVIPSEFRRINPELDSAEYRPTGDIAVLQWHKRLDFDSLPMLAPINLPIKQKNYQYIKYTNAIVVVTGFGADVLPVPIATEGGKILFIEVEPNRNTKLKMSNAIVLRKDVCLHMLLPATIAESHLCAQTIQYSAKTPGGVCYGDIGGPLVQGDTIIGLLVNIRDDCNDFKFPAVYTRITSFIPFIEEAMFEQYRPTTRVASYTGESVKEITAISVSHVPHGSRGIP